MPKRLMWVEYEDDAELSQSHKSPGDYSPLTRDPDRKLGHVTLSDADEYEWGSVDGSLPRSEVEDAHEPQWSEEDLEALAVLISAVVLAARPHVERWWKEHALPAIKATNESVRKRFARSRKAGRQSTEAEVDTSVSVAPHESQLVMSRDEAEQRLLAALVARAFSDEQLRVLLGARIEDVDGRVGFRSLLEQFTPEQVEGHVNLMLEANPAFLDDFVALCRGEQIHHGASLPREMTDSGKRRLLGRAGGQALSSVD